MDFGSCSFAMRTPSRRPCLLALALASSAFSPASAQSQVPVVTVRDARLLSSDLEMLDSLGFSVSSSGNTAVVGAPGADANGQSDAGAAYVFVRAPFGWIQQAKLVAADGTANDAFGNSVAIDGDRLAVGALRASVGGVALAGAVYVYERTGSTWTQTDKLVGIGADAGEGVGWSLALQGDVLVAGAVDDHHLGGQFNGGAAYVFVRGTSGWTQEQRVVAGDGEAFDYFGHAVALDGDRLVVGAYSDNHPGRANGGSVYSYARASGVWSLLQKVVPADNGDNDEFGWSVALQGSTLAVGAVSATVNGAFSAGAAYVFEHGSGGFSQTQKVVAATPGQYERMGSAVALDGELLIVGQSSGENAAVPYAGSVLVLQRDGGGFSTAFDLRTTVVEQGSDFGFAVALEDGLALVGAPGDDTAGFGQNSGSVYAYRLEPAVSTYCTAKVNSVGCTPAIGWTGLPSLSSPAPFTVLASLVLNQRNGLCFYGFAPNSAPFQGGTMCVASPVRRTGLQGSGGSANGSDCTGAYAFDANAWMQGGSDPEILVGSELFAQYWSRDPQAPYGTGLTDALRFFALP